MLKAKAKTLLRKLMRRQNVPELPDWHGDSFYCPVCQDHVKHFRDLSAYFLKPLIDNQCIHPIFMAENPNLLNYSCPACGASDRDRLFALYFEKIWGKAADFEPQKFLDIAPSEPLAKRIRSYPFVEYRSADLYNSLADDQVDLTDMSIYEDTSWDGFLCSHVLEHIQEDRKAMAELYRILKPGGWGLVLVPILLNLESDYENPEITDPGERWKHFGQDDHVRMYSKQGFVSKLEQVGFVVKQLGSDFFSEETMTTTGIHPRTVLYVVHKS